MTIIEPHTLLIAGADDDFTEEEAVTIFEIARRYTGKGIPLLVSPVSYVGTRTFGGFPEGIREIYRDVVGEFGSVDRHDLEETVEILERARREKWLNFRVGGKSFDLRNAWSNKTLGVDRRKDLFVFDQCVPDLCQMVQYWTDFLFGIDTNRNLFVDPRITFQEEGFDNDCLYRYIGVVEGECVFQKLPGYCFAE